MTKSQETPSGIGTFSCSTMVLLRACSTGALIALHFALRNKNEGDNEDAFVYVLEPDRLEDHLKALEELKMTRRQWKAYVKKHPFYEDREFEWEHAYMPRG